MTRGQLLVVYNDNTYWPDGTLKSTVAPGNITTEMTYDKNGNRLTITDPSAGVITNTYYGTGQPHTIKNADNETTTYYYQTDGLLDYYTSPEGTTDYSYNTNKLVSNITSPGGVSRSYTYETGKIKTVTESIGGISNLVTFEYDSKGRLSRKYFNGTTEYEQYDYDTNSGYLYRIQFTAGGVTTTVWQLTTMDEYSRIRQATIGSTSASWAYDGNNMLSQIAATGVQQYDYSFDVNLGNLNSRTNYLKSKTESFGYDANNLDRLATVTGPVNASISYTPDKNGNILTKSDAGTYAYNETPYAVSDISNHQNISSTPQTINYYSFEKVKDITEGTKAADFVYNADRQRIRMTLKTSGTTTKTRWYFGSNCEREDVGGTITQYIWIGGDAYTAVAVAKKVGTGSWTVYNIFRDHLGTITHLKNGSNPADEYSFDAWGRRRDKDDWTYTLTSEPALFADRGFTAHEYLEDFKLYNMNGRMYDPVVGRFLSPDPFVQAPDFSQNFNRYSYALNNPLRSNDLSGYTWGIFKPFVKFGKWVWNDALPAIDPVVLMQKLNDKTEKLRKKMDELGVPDFTVGGSVSLDGKPNFKADYRGQEVFNTANKDRSNATQKVNQAIADARQASRGVYFMQADARLAIPILELGFTTSIQAGLIFDTDLNVAAYISPSLGGSSGGGAFAGVSMGGFPGAKSISDVKGWGENVGAIYAIGGKGFGAEGNLAIGASSLRLGGTYSPWDYGYGGAGYVDFSYSFITKPTNLRSMTIEDFANFLNRYTPNSNYSPNDALQIFQLIYNTTNP